MRYLCAKCDNYFSKLLDASVAEDERRKSSCCPVCETPLLPFGVGSEPWRYGVTLWFFSTLVVGYCSSLILQLAELPRTAVWLFQLVCMAGGWGLYKRWGVIYTKVNRDVKK